MSRVGVAATAAEALAGTGIAYFSWSESELSSIVSGCYKVLSLGGNKRMVDVDTYLSGGRGAHGLIVVAALLIVRPSSLLDKTGECTNHKDIPQDNSRRYH